MRELRENALNTREDMFRSLETFLKPLEERLKTDDAYLKLGYVFGAYSEECINMEGLCRLLWGVAPAIKHNKEYEKWATLIWKKLLKGMDPKDKDYYGELQDFDQHSVEMAAIGFSLALNPEFFWDPLSSEEKENVYNWLVKINEAKLGNNNWQMFRVLVNLGLEAVGKPIDEAANEEALNNIESFYKGNGWYSDGKVNRYDYYISFAIHYYSLIYAKFREKKDPKRAKIMKERAAKFAQDFIYWFSNEGASIPFGRSLTYRMAQCSFWGAILFSGVEVEGITKAEIKGIILRHLRDWFSKPILNEAGILSVGYNYPNQHMAEHYNSAGSPYWAFKAFIFLALDEKNDFFTIKEEKMPLLKKNKLLKEAHMIIQRPVGSNNVIALTSGQKGFELGHCREKYGKFAYSTDFGFNVGRENINFDLGAFDSTLVFTEDGFSFVHREGCIKTEILDNHIYSKWKPYRDVCVETYLINENPWQIRIHKIQSGRDLIGYECGFSARVDRENGSKIMGNNEASYDGEFGFSGVVNLEGDRVGEVFEHAAGCNLVHPYKGCIPTLKGEIKAGETYIWASAIYAEKNVSLAKENWAKKPLITIEQYF